MPEVSEELPVSLCSTDRRLDDTARSESLGRQATHHLPYCPAVAFSLAHDTSLANLSLSQFELRLDEKQQIGGRGGQPRQHLTHGTQRNERQVGDDEIERAAEVCRRAVPDIGSIPHVDTRVPADRPVQLTVTDIDGANARGSVLEQTIGESSGRCTRIETAFTRRVDCESVQRCFELQTTP